MLVSNSSNPSLPTRLLVRFVAVDWFNSRPQTKPVEIVGMDRMSAEQIYSAIKTAVSPEEGAVIDIIDVINFGVKTFQPMTHMVEYQITKSCLACGKDHGGLSCPTMRPS